MRTASCRSGISPTFSRDSKYLAWTVETSIKEREKLTREKKPIRSGLTVATLASGAQRSYEAVRLSTFSPNARFIAMLGYAPTEIKGKGATLRVVELATGTEMSFQDVGEYRWSDEGSLLAMTITTGTPTANGVQLYDPATGRVRALESSASSYRVLTFRKGSSDLVFFRSVAPAGTETPGESVIVWRALAGTPTRFVLDSNNAALGSAFDVVDQTAPRWSLDGQRVVVSTRPRPAKADSTTKSGSSTDSASTVQIWHTSDVQLFPAQQNRLAADARRGLPAVWQLSTGTLTRVGLDPVDTPTLLEGWRHAVEKPTAKYAWGTMFGRRYVDVVLTDLATGQRTTALEKVRYSYESGEGRYLLWYDGKDYWTYEIASGKRTNITAGLATSFVNSGSDSPTDVTPPYGVGGWLTGDRAVLLYDQYDVWRVAPDGSSRVRLTNGRDDRIIHRVQRLEFDAPTLDATKPLYVTLLGERDKRMGWARLTPGGEVRRLIYLDKSLRQFRKADSSATFIYRAEDRADSPDVFVTGAEFTAPRQITRTNSFLGEYAWTREELLSFTSEGGRPLQGILLYPANYDASKKYPMIVYTYERLSDELHSWVAPSERSYYNQTAWTLEGYFVLMPDIVFTAREPGISTIQSVRAAVKVVTDRGLVDPKRVGQVGHSWGGYEAAYLGTHGGDFLATTIAGASITDLVSFMGQMHWASGTAESDHSETGQARMEVPYWEDRAAHQRNSALERVDQMTIPMLMAHGNKDGTVEFFQATEFFNFARRAGKQVVLLVYDGEDHGFSKKANQIDYQRRILEWFGHWLKGDPAPAWITAGIKAVDTPAEIKRVAEKRGTP
ncbi:MAG: S9 family peptidase [Gemmatimonadetes bacterium]|nr:S9 family peptidase [Gemmatimonadota bacterium]